MLCLTLNAVSRWSANSRSLIVGQVALTAINLNIASCDGGESLWWYDWMQLIIKEEQIWVSLASFAWIERRCQAYYSTRSQENRCLLLQLSVPSQEKREVFLIDDAAFGSPWTSLLQNAVLDVVRVCILATFPKELEHVLSTYCVLTAFLAGMIEPRKRNGSRGSQWVSIGRRRQTLQCKQD